MTDVEALGSSCLDRLKAERGAGETHDRARIVGYRGIIAVSTGTHVKAPPQLTVTQAFRNRNRHVFEGGMIREIAHPPMHSLIIKKFKNVTLQSAILKSLFNSLYRGG